MKNFTPSTELRSNFASNTGVVEILSYIRLSIAELQQLNEEPHGIEITQDIRGQIKSLRAILAGFAPPPKELEKTAMPTGSGLNLDTLPYGMSL